MDLDYDGVAAWLRERLGRRVLCSVQGDGNTGLSVVGPLLQRDHGEVQLIDPRPGRVEAWSVGGATLLLLEGDLAEARAVGSCCRRRSPAWSSRSARSRRGLACNGFPWTSSSSTPR